MLWTCPSMTLGVEWDVKPRLETLGSNTFHVLVASELSWQYGWAIISQILGLWRVIYVHHRKDIVTGLLLIRFC